MSLPERGQSSYSKCCVLQNLKQDFCTASLFVRNSCCEGVMWTMRFVDLFSVVWVREGLPKKVCGAMRWKKREILSLRLPEVSEVRSLCGSFASSSSSFSSRSRAARISSRLSDSLLSSRFLPLSVSVRIQSIQLLDSFCSSLAPLAELTVFLSS
jgi:hypothetical protein